MVEFLEFGRKLVTFGLVLGQIGNFLICSLLNKVIFARKFKPKRINFQLTFSCRTIIPNISFPLKAPIEYPSSKISEIESSKAGILKRKENCIFLFDFHTFLQRRLHLFTCTPKDTNQYWQHKVQKGRNFASEIPDFAQDVQTK